MLARGSLWTVGAACVALAGLSLLAPWSPTYDPWAWLVWGREVSGLELDTTAGPAWKPLPVLTTTVLAPLGDAAPALWLLLARAGGLLALVLAFRLAARLAGGAGRWFAGAVAALGLLATTGFLRGVAGGSSEGILIALLLLALDRHLDGRRGQAFGLGVAASLLRPEVWPFLAVYAVWLWRRDPGSRMPVAAGLTFVPVLWLAPELWGSGDLLRSSERALVPNPGQPALADHPAARGRQGVRHDDSAAGSAPGSGHDRARGRPARADPPCARRRLRSLGRPRRRDGPGRVLRGGPLPPGRRSGRRRARWHRRRTRVRGGRCPRTARRRAGRRTAARRRPSRPRSRQHAGSGASWPTRPSSAPTSPLRSSAPAAPTACVLAARSTRGATASRSSPGTCAPTSRSSTSPRGLRASSSAPSCGPTSRTARRCRPATSSWPDAGTWEVYAACDA